MIIKFQQNELTPQGVKTVWYLFDMPNRTNYTQELAKRIRQYLITNVELTDTRHPLSEATMEQFMGWHTGKYDTLALDEEYNVYELESDNSFASKQANLVHVIKEEELQC